MDISYTLGLDVLASILQSLNVKDLFSCSLVSKIWRKAFEQCLPRVQVLEFTEPSLGPWKNASVSRLLRLATGLRILSVDAAHLKQLMAASKAPDFTWDSITTVNIVRTTMTNYCEEYRFATQVIPLRITVHFMLCSFSGSTYHAYYGSKVRDGLQYSYCTSTKRMKHDNFRFSAPNKDPCRDKFVVDDDFAKCVSNVVEFPFESMFTPNLLFKTITYMVEHDFADPRTVNSSDQNLWHTLLSTSENLIFMEFEELAGKMIQWKVDPNVPLKNGRRPMHLAISAVQKVNEPNQMVCSNTLNFLLEAGADLSLQDSNGVGYVLCACRNDSYLAFNWLMSKGCASDVCTYASQILFSPLAESHVGTIVEAGGGALKFMSLPYTEENPAPSLLHAFCARAKNRQIEYILKLLLKEEHSYTVPLMNLKDDSGNIPFRLYIQRTDPLESVICLFLQLGADINCLNPAGVSLLENILDLKMLKPLEDYGKTASFPLWASLHTVHKKSLFHCLLTYASASCTRLWDDSEKPNSVQHSNVGSWGMVMASLLEAYPKLLEFKDEHNNTLLMQMAVEMNDAACLFLMDYDAIDLKALNDSGETLFHKCAEMGLASLVKELLQFNTFDVNGTTNSQETALHLACRNKMEDYGHLETMELLLKCQEVEIHKKNAAGIEAVQYYLEHSTHLEPLKRLGAGAIHMRIMARLKRLGVALPATTGKRKAVEIPTTEDISGPSKRTRRKTATANTK